MNSLKHIFSFIAILFIISCTGKNIKNDLWEEKLNGKVESVVESEYVAIEKFGEIQKGEIKHEPNIIKYDNKGYIIKRTYPLFAPVFGSIYITKYNDEHKVMETNVYYADGRLEKRIIKKHDKEGKVIK